MPKRIDTQARTAQIASAALRVLERDGLARLSVRGVASEAGIATASLRRAFPTQHALRVYCLDLIQERATARIRAITLTGRAQVDAILAQLLPLDAERRTELLAQVQLGVLAITDASLHRAAQELSTAVGQACRAAVGILARNDAISGDRDLDYEARRLHALLDGIAMQSLWRGHADMAPHMLDTLRRHLDELATQPPTHLTPNA